MKKIVYLLALVLLISTVLWSATPAARTNQGNKQTVPVIKKINPRPVLENGVTPKHISKFNAAPIDGYVPESKAARGGVEVVWEEDFETEEDLYYYVGLSYIWDSPGEFTKYAVRYTSFHGSILEGAYFYFYNGTSTNVDVTVLSDNAGYPGSVLGSVSYTPTVGGWNYVDLSSLSLTFTGGQDFYISFESTVNNVTIISDDGSGTANRSLVWTGTDWEYAYENAYCGGPYEWAMDAILTYTDSWTTATGHWQYLEDSPTAKDTTSHSPTHCWWIPEGVPGETWMADALISQPFYIGGDHNIYQFSMWVDIEFMRTGIPDQPGYLDELYRVFIADTDDLLTSFWHIDTFNAYSGNSWWCGANEGTWSTPPGYGNYWNHYVETPSMDLSAASASLNLDFWQRSDSEPDYDFCDILITVDNWATSDVLASYDGAFNTWYNTQIDLSAYAGESDVIVRFLFTSDGGWSDEDGSYDSDGAWFLDDVVISDDRAIYFQDNADDQVNFIPNPDTYNWVVLFYDYDRDYPAASLGYELVDKNFIFNGTCDITAFKNKNVVIRIDAQVDDASDEPGVQGAGLFIDDLAITGISLPEIDMQCDRVVVPYPQTEGLANPKPWIIYHQAGYGSSGANGRCDVEGLGSAYPLFDFYENDASNLEMEQYGAYPLSLQAPAYTAVAGTYNFQAWNSGAFEGRADSFAPEHFVEIYPPGEYELGYNSRDLGNYYFPTCTGAVVYYSPFTDGIFAGPQVLTGLNHIIYNRGQDYGTDALLTFEVYEAATESTFGALIYTEDIWFTIDPSERFTWLQIPFAQDVLISGDFFVHVTGPFINGAIDHVPGNFDYFMLVDTGQLYEDEVGFQIYAGHSFNYNAGTLEEYPSNFYINALFNMEYQFDAPSNVVITAEKNPFAGTTVEITWDAPRFANASTRYKIYSDDDAYGTYSTVVASGISGTSHSFTSNTSKKFYRVVTD